MPPSVDASVHNAVVDSFIAERLPAWLKVRAEHDPLALQTCFSAYRDSRMQVQRLLAKLLSPETFTQEHLEHALQERLGLRVNLATAVWRTSHAPGHASQTVPALSRLMRNFIRGATFPAGSVLLSSATGAVVSADLPAIAALCRREDVGLRYQEHLSAMLDDIAVRTLVYHEHCRFALSLEIARRQTIFKPSELSLLYDVLSGRSPSPTNSRHVDLGLLEVLGSQITGALVVDLRGNWAPEGGIIDTAATQAVLLYLPHLGTQALCRFESWAAVSAWLGQQLRDVHSREPWLRTISAAERAGFLARLSPRLLDPVTDPSPRRVPFAGTAIEALSTQFVARTHAEAAARCVPTATLDQAQEHQREQAIEGAGWLLFNLIGAFVPVLSELLLAEAVVQVVGEVVEGARSWSEGHRHEAMAHMLEVAKDVSLNVAIGFGLSAAARGVARVARLDACVPVRVAQGPRLWHDDLTPFVSPPTAQARLQVNGLLSDGKRWWWQHDEITYAVQCDVDGDWTLKGPPGYEGHEPLLRGNDDMAWALAHRSLPESFSDGQLLRSLYPKAREWPANCVEALMRISDLTPGDLRACLEARQPLPALWHDTLERLGRNQEIACWFTEEALLDTARRPEILPVLRRLGLAGASPVVQVEALRENAELVRTWLFETASAHHDEDDPLVRLIRRDFPGLSPRAVEEVVGVIDATESVRMIADKRLSLKVAERARRLLEAQRAQRMIEALYLYAAPGEAALDLIFGLLRRHAAWPPTANVEVRWQSRHGRCLARLYPETRTPPAVLVQREGEFRVAVSPQAEDEPTPQPLTLFDALLTQLPQEHRQRLGWANPDSTLRMRSDLQAWLPATHAQVLQVAGRRQLYDRPRWPTRQPDGRIGYPLSGRGAAGHPVERTLRRRLASLYPGLDQAQLDEHLAQLHASPLTAYTWILEQEHALRRLEVALRVWQEHPVATTRAARRAAAIQLRGCWQRVEGDGVGAGGRELRLSDQFLGALPPLPASADFSHVRHLRISAAGLEAVPHRFLERFAHLTRLDLSRNRLTEIPEPVREMEQLEWLNLAGNAIQVGQDDARSLLNHRQLRVLVLDGNPLGAVPLELGGLFRLTTLQAQGCQLREMPIGLLWCTALQRVDVRDNLIRRISPALMSAPLEFRRLFWLHGNPLPLEVRQRFAGFGQPVALSGAEPVAPDRVRSLWLEHLRDGERQQRDERWRQLQDEPGAAPLFALFGELLGTTDFRYARASLERRLFRVLDAAAVDTELRESLFDLAVHERTCVDGVMTCFNLLEVRVYVHESIRDAPATGRETALVELGKRLFRLQKLEEFARQDMNARPSARPADEVEVSLAYRVGLTSRLNLPGQASTLQFAQLAEVGPAELEAAYQAVRAAERSPALCEFLSTQTFWCDYLRDQYAQRFTDAEQPFWKSLEELETQRSALSEGAYLVQANTLAKTREDALQALILSLTESALSKPAI